MAPRGEVHFPSKDLPKARRSIEGHSSFGDMTQALQGVPIHLTSDNHTANSQNVKEINQV